METITINREEIIKMAHEFESGFLPVKQRGMV